MSTELPTDTRTDDATTSGQGVTRDDASSASGDHRMARALGWFSLGLGLAEVVAPNGVARMIGIDDDDHTAKTLRVFGLREIASGVGILAQPQASGWLWSRVGGDAMDLAVLGRAFGSEGAHRGRLAAATAAVVGVTILDVLCSAKRTRADGADAAA